MGQSVKVFSSVACLEIRRLHFNTQFLLRDLKVRDILHEQELQGIDLV